MRVLKSAACLLAFAAIAAVPPAKAEKFPEKPVNAIVGFAAGGGTDVYARILSSVIPEYLNGQPLVVVNKPGGAQVPAMKMLKAAKPDGHTVMVVSLGSAIISTGLRDHGVDLMKDCEIVAQFGVTNIMVAASKNSGFKTPQDVIEGIKKAHAEGRKLRWGSAGRSSITTLAMIAWLNKHGVYDMTQDVPFKGGAEVRVALIGNNVDFGVLGTSNASRYVDQINIIATFSGSRDPAQPDIPTLGDLKSDYVAMETPIIVAVPKDTPKDRIALLAEAIKKSTESPALLDLTTKAGQSVVYRGPDETRQFAEKLSKEWKETIEIVKKRIGDAKD